MLHLIQFSCLEVAEISLNSFKFRQNKLSISSVFLRIFTEIRALERLIILLQIYKNNFAKKLQISAAIFWKVAEEVTKFIRKLVNQSIILGDQPEVTATVEDYDCTVKGRGWLSRGGSLDQVWLHRLGVAVEVEREITDLLSLVMPML